MDERKLRNGYTTGACASAAAKAAAIFVCRSLRKGASVAAPGTMAGLAPDEVELTLPEGSRVRWKVAACEEAGWKGCFYVCKDSGDDPDVTNGVRIYARVERIDADTMETLRRDGTGYWLEEYPKLYLAGGSGIGLVTREGLSCPVGHVAINPVPRRMILSAVHEVCREAEAEELFCVTVAIPEGVELAKKTFNRKLGIVDGLSVLGTTGIVRPMSEEALLETIRLDIRVKAAAGERIVLLAPGNYGEGFLRDHLGVPIGETVLCSNFVADAARMLAEEGVRHVLFTGHIGKLVKVSAGMRNTHSRYGDGRMEELARLTQPLCHSMRENLPEQILSCNTTEEATEFLLAMDLAGAVFEQVARKVKTQMETWANGRLRAETIVFSSVHGVVGQTKDAGTLLAEWKRWRGMQPETGESV